MASKACRRNCRRDVMSEMPLCGALKRLRADSARAPSHSISFVMAGLDPAIHVFFPLYVCNEDVDAGTRPGMTTRERATIYEKANS